jgi:hypothetical protein
MLRELFRIQRSSQLNEVFITRHEGHIALPLAFVLAGIGAYLLGAGPLFTA